MPPRLALVSSLVLTCVLLRREVKRQPIVSMAVWIPCVWLLITGSRPVSQWLNLDVTQSADALMDGSPTDRLVYLTLMITGAIVVWRRRLDWMGVVSRNRWLMCYFAYCAMSVMWSDFPAVAAKRWVKSLGDPLMVLILLSDPHPAAAVGSALRRCAFVLVPLSIVFIKYYPDLGRAYDLWSGAAFFTGVTTNKNLLGYLLLAFGLFFLCTLLTRRRSDDQAERSGRRLDTLVVVSFLVMIAWLFRMADSQTPLVALFVAMGVVVPLGLPVVRRHFGAFAVSALLLALVLELTFHISEMVVQGAGRNMTFTGRTEIWAAVLNLTTNPFLGAGFESFWLGERLEIMWSKFPVFRPNQAHNGYIQIYLNLGWVGLCVFAGVLVASLRSVVTVLRQAVEVEGAKPDHLILAKFGLGYLVAYVFYNVTEAIFQPMNFLFVIFLTLAVEYHASDSGAVSVAPTQRRSSGDALPLWPLGSRALADIYRGTAQERIFDPSAASRGRMTAPHAPRAKSSRW